MIKKITLALVICCLMVACGKKGDPEYKGSENKTKLHNVIIKKI